MSQIRSPWFLASLVLVPALVLAGCGPDDGGGNATPTLTGIAVAPGVFSLAEGETQQLTVTGRYDDGSAAPLTSGVGYESSDAAVATVDDAGLVTAVAAGEARIDVTVSGFTVPSTVTVTHVPVLTGIALAPAEITFQAGGTEQLTVTGTYDDGSTETLTDGVTYESSDAAVATVSTSGLVTAVGEGEATVTATAAELTATASVTVTAPHDPILTRIDLSPATLALAPEDTEQLTVTGTYDDGSTQTLSTGVTFASSDAGIATVDGDGLVTAVADGSATITATETASGETATAEVTVATPAPQGFDVFTDDYAADVTFVDFGGATNALSVDTTEAHDGAASLKVEVPAGNYTGGALVAASAQDLTAYDALTFWVKASQAATLNTVGLGNDGIGGMTLSAERTAIAVDTTWQQVVVPLPNPAKAAPMIGLFHFAEGADEGAYTLWFDDIRYVSLAANEIGSLTGATFAWQTLNLAPGGTFTFPPAGNTATFDLPAATLSNVGPGWFDLASDDTAVATVDAAGTVTGVADGTATLTAKLGDLDVSGSATVNVTAAAQEPTAAPAAPTAAEADVISLFSQAYTDVTVDTWKAGWSPAVLTDVTLAGEPMKKYEGLGYAGIEFGSAPIDATGMDYFHVDLWTPNATEFRVKLVDFGADGAYGGGDDTEHEWIFDDTSTPALADGEWIGLDLPLSALPARGHLAQLIFTASPNPSAIAFVDNLYFYAASAPQEPATAPAAPTAAAADVVSLFSQAYTDHTVDTWLSQYSAATVAQSDVTLAGEPMKQYTGLGFAIIEFTSGVIDTTSMTHFHVDVWTPNATAFRVKLVDFGANGVWDAAGDDVEHEWSFDAASSPALTTGTWVGLDVPLSDLPTRAHVAQLVISADPGGSATVFLDNLYFY